MKLAHQRENRNSGKENVILLAHESIFHDAVIRPMSLSTHSELKFSSRKDLIQRASTASGMKLFRCESSAKLVVSSVNYRMLEA